MPSTLDPETRELLNEVKTQLAETSKVNTINIYENGTKFIGAGDPLVDDQDGRDRE